MDVGKWARPLTPGCCSQDMYSLVEEKTFIRSLVEKRFAGARRKSPNKGIEEGVMGKHQGLGGGRTREASEHEGIQKHRQNVGTWSQSTRISGKEKSISNDTHPTHCLNYGLLRRTPTSAKQQECKNEQLSSLRMFRMSSSKI